MALTIDHFKVYLLLLCRVCNFISPRNWSFLIKSHFSIKQFYATVGEGLKKIYKAKLLPLEEAYEFHEFISPPLNEPDFDAKPMIMFVGQYSTGKNSWNKGLLQIPGSLHIFVIRFLVRSYQSHLSYLFILIKNAMFFKSFPHYLKKDQTSNFAPKA